MLSGQVDTNPRLSKRMKAVEALYGRPIETVLRTFYYDEGKNLEEMSAELGIPIPTIGSWMRRLGIAPSQLAQQKAREMAS